MPDDFDDAKFDLAACTALKFGYDIRFATTSAQACKRCDLYCHCSARDFSKRCREIGARCFYLRLEANKRENAAHELIDFFASPDYDTLLAMERAHG